MVPFPELWRAWPSGYLAVRGLRTVGGWECVTGTTPDQPRWVPPYEFVTVPLPIPYVIDTGVLLPLVDAGDPASWGILKRDLAAAFFEAEDRVGERGTNFWWRREGDRWVLNAYTHDRPHAFASGSIPGLDTSDPQLALVRARAHCHVKMTNAAGDL